MPTDIDAAILYEPNQPLVIEKIQLKDPNEYSKKGIVIKPILLMN